MTETEDELREAARLDRERAAAALKLAEMNLPEPDTTDLRTGPHINDQLLALLPLVGRLARHRHRRGCLDRRAIHVRSAGHLRP